MLLKIRTRRILVNIIKMFDFLNKIMETKTTSLEEYYEDQAYMKERLRQAEIKGKANAKVEKKQPKTKSAFEKFQDYCTDFANRPSAIGKIKFNSKRKK